MQTATTANPLERYSGTWQTKLKDSVYLTIRLQVRDGKLTGSTNRVDTEFDKDGVVASARQLQGDDAITEAKLKDDSLRIMTEDEDALQLEIKITGQDQAELRILDMSDHSAIKPLLLRRIAPQ